VTRFLAAIPKAEKPRGVQSFGEANPDRMVPRAEWKRHVFDQAETGVPIYDQGAIGSCGGHACAETLMEARAQAGYTPAVLAPCWVYSHVNNGIDQGSSPTDGVKFMQQVGVALLEQVPETVFNKAQIPDYPAALATASRFKAGRAWPAHTWEEIVSATIWRRSVILTVNVAGPDWQRLPASGIPRPVPGMGNHAIRNSKRLAWSKTYGAVIGGANSWNTTWGLGGRLFLCEGHFDRQPYLDCWVLDTPVPDPSDAKIPHPAT
jgi:hypothetical protein